MIKTLAVAVGGIMLVSLLAWSSLATAAPAARGTPVPAAKASATATKHPVSAPSAPAPTAVDAGQTNPEDNSPDLGPDSAAASPVGTGPMKSQILVFNLDTVTATVGINFYDPTGVLTGTISAFPVSPNGAVAQALPASIASGFKGSAVVSSDRKVQAFVTDSNGANKARDEYDGTLLPNPKLILPFVRHLAKNTQNSIIAVQNTGNASADVTLQLYQPNGTLGPSQTLTGVAPLASAYFNTNALFPSGTFTGTAQVSATGGVALAGSEQARYSLDTASFRALTSADDATKLYVGFVERRRNSTGAVTSWSEIYVRNDGASPTDITATFYSAAGALMSAATKTRLQVPANGLAQFQTNGSGFKSLTQTAAYFKGWAAITSGGQPISLYALEAQNSGGILFGTNGSGPTGSKFACGDTFRNTGLPQYSTINIVNPTANSASVTIKLYKPSNGASGGIKTVAVGPKKLVSVSLSDSLFSAAGSVFEGLAVVTSNGPKVFTSVYTPYPNGGVTSYTCAKLQ